MIAVAERRLGDGILQRFDTVNAIRGNLNSLGRYVALHLLGTGNPISIATYTAAGADSFDGLEWCQTVVDHDSGLLYHLSQAEFFATQTAWADAGLSFQARTLAHNLEFFAGWMNRLREAVHQGRISEFCRLHFPSKVYSHVAQRAGWVLQ
jgi:queuine/archaeosine tRNA-ribosyltransferase